MRNSAYENGLRERLTRFTCGTHTPLVIRSRRPLSSTVDRFSAGLRLPRKPEDGVTQTSQGEGVLM
ncbi:MAG: hypothetical protein ACLFO5_07515, partial [Opitutales bacterium]